MSQARYARFRGLRGAGWSIALPLAGFFGLVVGVVIQSVHVGLVAGACASLFGLLVLSISYSLGEIWGGYWMIPTALAGLNISLITYALGGEWTWALIGTSAAILMMACVAAISRTADGEGGLLRLLGHFFRGLIPGQYPR
jgi:hypothetical protein